MVSTRRRRIVALGATSFLIGFGCTTTTDPPDPVATTITVAPATATLTAIGATRQLTATVKDQSGATMTGQTVTWNSGTASVATVNNSGLVTAVGNGTSTITASVGNVNGTAGITVAQTVTSIAISAGDAQSATAGAAVAIPPAVLVRDAGGNAVSGATVTFSVTQGGGSVTGGAATSNASGIATVGSWTLGPAAGTNMLSATSGSASAVAFTATGTVGVAATVTADAGNGQQAVVGNAVAVAPRVLVTDATGNPVPGETVTFTVTSGGGVAAVSAAAAVAVVTDAAGLAAVSSWTLGITAGAQTLDATVGALTPVVFTATGTADAAASITAFAGAGQTATAGTPVPIPPVALVQDQHGNPVAGVAVTFAVGLGGGSITGANATTNAAGMAAVGSWTLGGEGLNMIMASAGALTPAQFLATATSTALPATIEIANGDGQSVLAGSEVVIPPSVLVKDFTATPVAGATVNFAVTAGGGTLTGATAITDAMGIATAGSWTYGGTAGTNDVTATVSGVTPVVFTGEGVNAGFDIEVVHLVAPSTEAATAFANAEARWEALVVSELANVDFATQPITANACGINHPSFAGMVDDMLIWVRVEPIDGPLGTLANAGPCVFRTSPITTTVIGIMRIDADDLADLIANGSLEEVVLHEMGHVLGIGTWWDDFGLLQNPSLPSSPGVDTHFDGNHAIVAFDRLGGTTYTGGEKVPVENTQGAEGTRDAHWREATFDNELMTGFINAGANPLSLLTIASLADIGFAINPDGADAYVQVFTAPAPLSPTAVELKDDIWVGPLYRIEANGRHTRVR